MTHITRDNSFHPAVQPRPLAESYISASEDAISGSRSCPVSNKADSGHTFSMDYSFSSDEELRLMMDKDIMELIPLLL
jgi:hypothetical protein